VSYPTNGPCSGRPGCKGLVKVTPKDVKKPSTTALGQVARSNFLGDGPCPRGRVGGAPRSPRSAPRLKRTESEMVVLVFIVLTVAVFALLGLVQKLVERL
jgi:hypothetical protein